MLAYVFWHTAQPSVDPAEYERLLVSFHEALGAERPEGVLSSATFRIAPVPWLESEGAVYEDWYLVRDSAALDVLNDAAMSAHRQQPHDEVAAVAGAGAGGLYRLRLGSVDLAAARVACWLSKPPSWDYAAFYDRIAPLVEGAGGTLWGRQMVLGPAPEFCLQTTKRQDVPGVICRTVNVEPVWSGEGNP